ncbi:MAG: phage tail tape measure protein [Muribaculaceae bacterium]|nr:phage tail tape measure protein [Muribaculaceae bacterium]
MSNINSQATVNLTVNGQQPLQVLQQLKQRAMELENAIAKAAMAGNKVELRKLRRELGDTRRQMREIETATQQVERVMLRLDRATPKELNKTLQTLNRQLEYMERGSAAWNSHVAKIQRVKAELAKVNAELRTQESFWTRFNRKLNDWQTSLMGIAALVTGLVMAGRKAVNSYAEMEEEIANNIKYTGMARDEVVAMNESFRSMDTRTGRDKLNELAQEAGRLGKNTRESVQGYVEAADIINVALVDLGEGATQVIAKLTNIFGVEQMLGTKDAMLAVGSTVNVLSQNCTAAKPYLVQFAQRMAGVGAQARMTIPEILAFAATLDANGQKVEMSASALSRLIMMLFQKPQELAKTVGLDVAKFTETLNRSTNEGVLMFLGKLQEIGEADALAALSPLFKDLGMDGIRMSQVLATLATHLDMVKWEQKEANKAFEEATSATREYNIFNNTAQAGIDKARKHIHELAIELGEKLLPLYKHIMTSGSAMLRFLNVLVNFFVQYKGLIVTFTASWIAYKVAVSASNVAFKAHYYWLVLTEGAQKLLGTATLALKIAFYAMTGQIEKAKAAYTAFHLLTKTTPWGIILAAVTAVGVGLYNLCTRTDELTKKTNEAVKAAKGFNAEAVKEQHELDILFGRLKGAQKGTKEYEDAKRAIINQYGKYLSGLIDEKGQILNLEAAYNRLTLAVRRSAQERGIAAAREQIDQEYYKSLASGLTDLQAALEKAGATTREAAEIVAAVSQAMAAGKPIPQNYVNRINAYSKGIEARLLPDWIGGSQHPFWGGDSRKPAPIVNRMYNAYETHRKGMEALDAMEDGVSPLRHIDNYYLKGTIGQLEKIVKNGKAGNAIIFIQGTQQGEYREVSVSEAKQLLTQYREELAYRGAAKSDPTGMNLDTTGGTGGAAGSPGGAGGGTGGGRGGSSKTEDKFKAEKDWREYQEALNRIAYATGQKNYEEYTNRMLEIEEAFYRKQLAHADLSANERISIEAQLYEVLRKRTEAANKQSIEDEKKYYALRKSEVQQQYIDGQLSTEAYNEQMQRIELEHLKAIQDIYSEQAFKPVTEWEETKRKAAELMQTQFNGNVDLLNRPVIDAHELTKAGWKGNPQTEGEATATVYSSQYGIKDSTGQVREILVTPILPDGSVLTEKELKDYVYKTLQGAEDILEADDKGLVIAVDVSTDGKAGENLHLMQEAYYADKPNVDEQAWNNFLAAEAAYQDKLVQDQQKKARKAEEAERKHQEELKRIKEEFFGNNAAENLEQYNAAMASLDEVYQAEVKAAGDNAKEKLRIDEAYEKAKLALKKKYNQLGGEADRNALEKMNQDLLDWLNGDGGQAVTKSVEALTSGMSSIFSQLSTLVQSEMEIETAAIEKRYEREVSMAEGNKYKTKQLEKQKQKEVAKVKDEANRKLFAMQVIQAVAQTATAALNAYSSAAAIPVVGYIIAPIAAAMAVAAGVMQVAAIKKQQQASQAQGYAEGGFTPKGRADEVAGVVHAGEWVASQRLLASPVARPLIEALDYAQRTNTIGSLRQTDVSRTITAPAVLAQSQAPTVIVQENKALRETLARLNERLNEPFVTVNTVTGDLGIKQAQDDYQRLMNNKSPKNKRK